MSIYHTLKSLLYYILGWLYLGKHPQKETEKKKVKLCKMYSPCPLASVLLHLCIKIND